MAFDGRLVANVGVLAVLGPVAKITNDEQDNLNAALLAATGLANNGTATLQPAAEDLIAAIQRFRAPMKVLGETGGLGVEDVDRVVGERHGRTRLHRRRRPWSSLVAGFRRRSRAVGLDGPRRG